MRLSKDGDVDYTLDEMKGCLKQTFRYWGVLILLFNTALLAANLWYHEDLLGHILRHWKFLLLMGITANSLMGVGLLTDVYVHLWRSTRTTWLRHALRVLFFLIVTTAFIVWIAFWYQHNPVPHVPH